MSFIYSWYWIWFMAAMVGLNLGFAIVNGSVINGIAAPVAAGACFVAYRGRKRGLGG